MLWVRYSTSGFSHLMSLSLSYSFHVFLFYPPSNKKLRHDQFNEAHAIVNATMLPCNLRYYSLHNSSICRDHAYEDTILLLQNVSLHS